MLDVHPPHSPTHTWRDFFIHIATIVVGLIIAVGIEQTVETIHRHNERQHLIEDLREEAVQDARDSRRSVDRIVDQLEWQLAVIAALREAQANTHGGGREGMIHVTLPAHSDFSTPAAGSRAVWTLARSDGQAALLPETHAKLCERVETIAGLTASAVQDRRLATVAVRKQEARLNILLLPGRDITIPASEVPSLLETVAAKVTALRWEAEVRTFLIGANDGVADGVTDQTKLGPYTLRAQDSLRKRLNIPVQPF